MTSLEDRHPNFRGNWEDLQQFQLLADSPIRSPQREGALQVWEQYKNSRQFAGVPQKKGAHMWALLNRVIDLRGASFAEICVGYADLRGVMFDGCDLRGAWLKGAKLDNASLRDADLCGFSGRGPARLLYATLTGADLTGAKMRGVDLSFSGLQDATLTEADLSEANLSHTLLVRTKLSGANLKNARVYGAAAWDVQGRPAVQEDLIITPEATLGDKDYYYVISESSSSRPESAIGACSSAVTVDDLEVAQFVYLLLRNEKIRDVLDTIGHKGVLILGRFTPERKSVLDALRKSLRAAGFVPMMFDFERPTQRDFTETIKTLAGLSRFIIADITNPRASPLELQAIMPDYMIPFVPIIAEGEEPFAMFRDLKQKYGEWVLDPLAYESESTLVEVLIPAIVRPALEKSQELIEKKAANIRIRHASDYLDRPRG